MINALHGLKSREHDLYKNDHFLKFGIDRYRRKSVFISPSSDVTEKCSSCKNHYFGARLVCVLTFSFEF